MSAKPLLTLVPPPVVIVAAVVVERGPDAWPGWVEVIATALLLAWIMLALMLFA